METEREKERVVFFSVLDEFLLSFFWGGGGGKCSPRFSLMYLLVQNDNC